jgi:hypothetical protein
MSSGKIKTEEKKLSKCNELGSLIGRIVLVCVLGFAIGYFVANTIINAAEASERLPANQELLVEFLIHKNLPFLTMNNKLTVYADQNGKFPEWLTCQYVYDNISDIPLESITMKDYTASSTLRTEICLVSRFRK